MRAGWRAARRLGETTALVVAFASGARAVDFAEVCPDERIVVAGLLASRWDDAVAQLCARFGTMKDVEPSARLVVKAAGEDVEVDASLADARVAHRFVHSPDELLTVVEALTVVIPPARATPPAVPAPFDNNSPPPAPGPSASVGKAPVVETARSTPASEPRALGIELGLALESRLSGVPAYMSFGGSAYAGLRSAPWFIGLVARWQPSEVPATRPVPGFEMESAGAGFMVARRLFTAQDFALDAGASALIMVDTQSIETRSPDEVGSSTDARFGVLVRALVGHSSWRFAPSLDADLAPARVRRDVRVDPALPTLPSWSIALALGATWGEP